MDNKVVTAFTGLYLAVLGFRYTGEQIDKKPSVQRRKKKARKRKKS